MIHETAVVDPSAEIAEDAHIGPWTMIGPKVTIGSGCHIGPHAVVNGPTKMGKNNRVFQFASIGEDSQDKKFHGEDAFLEIGDNNIFREFCTVNRGTKQGGSVTSIGDDNLFMAYTHVAHDCKIGSHTIFSNNASLAGHVNVGDYAILSGFAAVHQFVTIGEHSFVAGAAIVLRDVLPFVLVSGDPAEPYGINSVGLKRREFTSEDIMALRRAYKVIYRQGLTVQEAVEKLNPMVADCAAIQQMITAIESSERGIAR